MRVLWKTNGNLCYITPFGKHSSFLRPKSAKSLVYQNSVRKKRAWNWKCAQRPVFFPVLFFSKPQISVQLKSSTFTVGGGFPSDCLLVNWRTMLLWCGGGLSLWKVLEDKADMSQAVLEWGQGQDICLICRVQLKYRQQPPAPGWTIGWGLEEKYKLLKQK